MRIPRPLEEVTVGLKLLPKHELPPVLDDEGVWRQVPHGFEDLLVLLNLTLSNINNLTSAKHERRTVTQNNQNKLQTTNYLHWGFEGGWVCVVRQVLAVALLFDTQQHLDILAVLIAAGLFVTLHPRLDFTLPHRRGLRRLRVRSGTLTGKTNSQYSRAETINCD